MRSFSSPLERPEIPAKKIQTDDDVALHVLSLIGRSVVNFPAQVKNQSHGIARVAQNPFACNWSVFFWRRGWGEGGAVHN